MLFSMEKQLNESQRDALVAAYMNLVAPTLPNANPSPLSIEALYEYLLIDPEVGDEVPSTRVASAISSVQQYITRIINGTESGFQPVEPSDVTAWRNGENQYAIWAAGVDVENYAEDYISPITRLEKSHYFKDLEATLDQNQLDPDRVQSAVLAYLNQFEAVSNLYVLSGYIAQDELKSATYYFIGRTTTRPYRYFWRQMDLANNGARAGKPVTPNCWSDWLPIDLPLASDTILEHTVRPVFYNERLYVAWVERDPVPLKDAAGNNTTRHVYRVKFGYKRFDDSWTAPNGTNLMTRQENDPGFEEYRRASVTINEASKDFDLGAVNLLATADHSHEPSHDVDSNPYGRLMLGVFVRRFDAEGETGKNAPNVYGYQYCDSAFHHIPLGPQLKEELFAIFKDRRDTDNTLQFALYKQKYVIEKVAPYKEGERAPDGGDIHGSSPNDQSYKDAWWTRIADLEDGTRGPNSYIRMTSPFEIRATLLLNKPFVNDFTFTQQETNFGSNTGFGFCRPDGTWGATIRYHGEGGTNFYTFEDTAIRYATNLFGNYTLAADQYSLCNVDAQNNPANLIDNHTHVNIGPHDRIAWDDDPPTSVTLDLSGCRLSDTQDVTNNSIRKNALNPIFFIDTQNHKLASIKNFGKIGDTRKFFEGIRFYTAHSNEVGYGDASYTLTNSAPFSASYSLQEADFTPQQRYISVCLIVGDDHIYRPDNRDKQEFNYVWKWFKVYLQKVDLRAPADPPQLISRYDSKRGLVQYLDFREASLPAKTRLNTTFVRELIESADLGLDSLLSYSLQMEPLEADLDIDGKGEPMDFNGANGLYFWELFFHLPFLVAWRFGNDQRFDQAQQWLHYIFDPALGKKASEDGVQPPPYWNVRPLVDRTLGDPSRLLGHPLDPDALAYASPEIYQKAVFIAYVSNLIAQGDQWYRQLTRDGLTQARVLYSLAADMLGPRPDVSLSSTWVPRTVDALASAINNELRAFEQTLDSDVDGWLTLPSACVGSLRLADTKDFKAPLNTLMLSHWDALDARLYNLRHNLTVDGKPLSLPLYAPPADPVALLAQRAQSGTLASSIGAAQLQVPHYRFQAILPRAQQAVATLSRFGDTLLSLIERADRAGQEELQQQQLLDMSSYAITLQQQAIDGLAADRQALEASRAVAQDRHDSYYALYQENISISEQFVMDTHTAAQVLLNSAQGVMTASGALKLVPNIFGLADGGSRYEGATEAVANGLMASSNALTLVADRVATSEAYRRRRQDWQIQYEQAQAEADAFDKQLDALTIREQAARTELARLKAQQTQTQAMLNFLKTRFTQATLYQWLSGKLSALYYQIYDTVVSLCLSTQACWQYELGDFKTTFIQTGAWNDHYRGLQVGETLQLNLHQMEAAYLTRNERRLEITRTTSLRECLGQDTFDTQKVAGTFEFRLTERLFDEDYPGHYLRQIKSVAVSLPTLLGPYQDVRATLTQTWSGTLLAADPEGVMYLDDPKQGSAAHVVTNLRANQQVALSSGLNDAGQFELNFGDERYLPFEGTGAVSRWTLAFPRHATSEAQIALLAALTDIIIHVRYTALDGGKTFADTVEHGLPG
ncbi:insecticidal toxin complex protein TccB [Burkholderia contaminans]|nr:insecticidal toxin complex protein TccB [Burkholderia contaminans]